MISNKTFWIIGIILLILSFILGRCSNGGEITTVPVKIVIPSESGTSEVITNPTPLKPNVGGVIKWKDSLIYTENPINEKLVQDYLDLEKKHSGNELEVERLKKILSFIQIKNYEIPIENEFFITTNKMKVQGELLEFKQDFKTKERTVNLDIPIKKRVEFMAGAEIGSTKELESFRVKGNLFLQLKNKSLINVAYDNKETFWVGYAFKF